MSKNKPKPTLPLIVYVALSIPAVGLLFVLLHFWPNLTPWPLFHFWDWNIEKIRDATNTSWPMFAWGGGITFLVCFVAPFNADAVKNAEEKILARGFFTSLRAGILEEPIFRWVLFYWSMVTVQISAFCFFGFISSKLEFTRLISWYIISPVVNFVSFFHLDWLLYEHGWAVGAGALAANAKFRNGHAYLGPFGYFNSWGCGFYLFWVMLNYGLPAAIVVHFVYDFIIDSIMYLHAVRIRDFGGGTDPTANGRVSNPRNPTRTIYAYKDEYES